MSLSADPSGQTSSTESRQNGTLPASLVSPTSPVKAQITPKQARFVDEYVIDRNGTRACIAAGYAPTAAAVQANRLLRRDKIRDALKAKEHEIATRNEVSQNRVVQELKAIAFGEIGQQTDDSGVFKLHELDSQTRLGEKLKALDQLCKLLGFNAPDAHIHAVGSVELDTHERARRMLGILNRAAGVSD